MRISTEPQDVAYIGKENEHLLKGVEVKLDGEVMVWAITADEEEGFVRCLVTDNFGRMQPDPDHPGMARAQDHYGTVEIVTKGKMRLAEAVRKAGMRRAIDARNAGIGEARH